MFRLRLLIITIVSFIFSSSAISQTKEEIDAAFNQVYSFLNQFNDSLSSALHRQDYAGAIEMCHTVDSVFKADKLNETFFYSYVLQNMTIAYGCIGDSLHVYSYGKQALQAWEKYKLFESDNGLDSYLNILEYVANSCIKQGKYEEAVEYLEKQIQKTDVNKRNTEMYAYSLYSLGAAYHYLLRAAESDYYLRKAKAAFEDLGIYSHSNSINELMSTNASNGDLLVDDRNKLLSELDDIESKYGIRDTAYLKSIIDAGILCRDTTYHKLWPSLAEKMLKVQAIIPAIYGIDSEEYRLYMVGLNALSLGRYIEKGDYINDIWDAIHSLEDIYSRSEVTPTEKNLHHYWHHITILRWVMVIKPFIGIRKDINCQSEQRMLTPKVISIL